MTEGGEIREVPGRCLCGAVTFVARIKSSEVGACHCGMCRRWSGGVMLAVEFDGDLAFASTDALGVYKSSDWGQRGFCKVCGTSLFWQMQGGGHGVVSPHALEGMAGQQLTHEIFIDEKPDYYSFAQATKKMTGAEIFAMFAPKPE